MSAYREEIYGRYASGFRGVSGVEVEQEVSKRERCYAHYLRDWLPDDHHAKIFEAGCGDGRLLAYLAKSGYSEAEGMDLSGEQVAMALKKGSRAREGDAVAYLGSLQAGLDAVVALDMVEHLGKNEFLKFLKVCRTALRRGGRLILQTPNAASPFFGAVRYGDFTHEIGLTPALLARLLVMNGFEDVQCRESGPRLGGGIKQVVRWALWKVIRGLLGMWDRVETGWSADIYTRVFFCSARVPSNKSFKQEPNLTS